MKIEEMFSGQVSSWSTDLESHSISAVVFVTVINQENKFSLLYLSVSES